MNNGSIAAISTPAGEGGIGVIRISGENAIEIADKVFKSVSGKKLSMLCGYSALFGHIYSGDEMIDEAVCTVFLAPKSYTGENVCEISCHGGNYVTKAVLRAVLAAGAVSAEPGEFTKRAFLNGKMDLAQAESVAGLIASKGEQELKLHLAAKNGKTSGEIDRAEKLLLEFSANLAAYSDYPDEDLPELSSDNFQRLLSEALSLLDGMISTYDTGKILREGVRTAIVGKPNVGKSTLMNLLAGSARSIVTDIAGTTRDIVEDTVRCGEITLCLADTAGIRETDDVVENAGVSLAKERIENAQLILAVFDSSVPLDEDDKQILELVKGKNCIVILNKTDKGDVINGSDFDGFVTVRISAKNGVGEKELETKIAEITGAKTLDSSAAVLLSERQRDLSVKARDFTAEALDLIKSGMTMDAVGILIDEALSYLYAFDGKRVTNEVADEVFRRFCVGK